VLFSSLSYPATFSISLSFFLLVFFVRLLQEYSLQRLLCVVFGATLILLTHPLTFVALTIWMLALNYEVCGFRADKRYLFLLITISSSMLAAFFWPFLPLYELVFSTVYVSDPEAFGHYENLILRYYPPFLIGLPVILIRLRGNLKDSLALAFMLLLIVYLYGCLTGRWNYGRVISFAIMILQIAVALWIVEISLATQSKGYSSRIIRHMPVGISLLLLLFLFKQIWTVHVPSLDTHRAKISTYSRFSFISDYVPAGQTVLSTVRVSKFIPSFGPKIVVFDIAPFFPNDYQERVADVSKFFAASTGVLREHILHKYRVCFVLLPTDELALAGQLRSFLEPRAELLYSRENAELYKIKSSYMDYCKENEWKA